MRRTRAVLREVGADVVVGFGGYVSLPAYLAAASMRLPIVVHEANARAGVANKVGARFATAVCAAVPGSGLAGAEVIGIPLRREITELDRAGLRAEARAHFGLDPQGARAAGVRGLAGCALAQRGRVRGGPGAHRGRGVGAARPRAEERAEPSEAPGYATRCPTSSAWTSPTPPRTSRCAGPAR